MNIITAEQLNLWYGANHALKDITIEIPERVSAAYSITATRRWLEAYSVR